MKLSVKTLKYLSSFCFIAIGLVNLIETLYFQREFWIRDLVILVILSLPLLVNKKLFYLGFGLLAAVVSLSVLFIFAFKTPSLTAESFLMYLLGMTIFLLVFISSLTMIFVGTFSKEKGRFKLI